MNRSERRKFERIAMKEKVKKKKEAEELFKLYQQENDFCDKNMMYIHAVIEDEDGEVWCHTHNMERNGFKNLSMRVPSKEYIPICKDLLNFIDHSMQYGERYNVDTTHVIDEYEGGPVTHAFYLKDSEDIDDYTGKKNLEIVYLLEEPVYYNGTYWFFDEHMMKWKDIGNVPDERPHYFNPVSGKWMAQEELMWLMFGDGEIPKGKKIGHKDGNIYNNAIDNLYLEDI